MTDAKQYLEALAFEREGYARRGLDDRVAEVDEQIKVWEKRAAAESRAQASEDTPTNATAEPLAKRAAKRSTQHR